MVLIVKLSHLILWLESELHHLFMYLDVNYAKGSIGECIGRQTQSLISMSNSIGNCAICTSNVIEAWDEAKCYFNWFMSAIDP